MPGRTRQRRREQRESGLRWSSFHGEARWREAVCISELRELSGSDFIVRTCRKRGWCPTQIKREIDEFYRTLHEMRNKQGEIDTVLKKRGSIDPLMTTAL